MKGKLFIALAIIAVIVGILIIANSNFSGGTCKAVNIKVEYADTNKVITQSDIQDTLNAAGIKIIGEKIGDIDFERINKVLARNRWIEESRVNSDYNGCININVKQRQPVLRVIDAKKKSYILDAKGCVMPLQDRKPLWLCVARGLITDSVKTGQLLPLHDTIPFDKQNSIPTIQKVLHVALEMQKDSFLRTLIGEIYVNDGNHYTLIPAVGTQVIEFGGAVDAKDKMMRLKQFYLNAFSNYDMSIYKAFDVRFRKQVIGIKKYEKQEDKEHED